MVDRAFDLGRLVLRQIDIGRAARPDPLAEAKDRRAEGGKVAGAVPETNRELVFEVLAVESVHPVERRGEQDLAERVGVGGRLDPDDPQQHAASDRHGR